MRIGDELSVSSPELGMVRARIVYIHPLHRFVTAAVATRSYGDILESFHLGRREKRLPEAENGEGSRAVVGLNIDSPEMRTRCFSCRLRQCSNCLGRTASGTGASRKSVWTSGYTPAL